ncbi:MAG TPA: hypothetical protein VGV92_08660 [Gammaproteobacteria bacterium]|nr:hypothetical protein [Gammaproteobacteria bacterium]
MEEKEVYADWLSAPNDILRLILEYVKKRNGAKNTLAFALTCKRFLHLYCNSDTAELQAQYLQGALDALQKTSYASSPLFYQLFGANKITRSTTLVSALCRAIAFHPDLEDSAKVQIIDSIDQLLHIETVECFFPAGCTQLKNHQPPQIPAFLTLMQTELHFPSVAELQDANFQPSDEQRRAIRQTYQCFHADSTVFEQCADHDVVMDRRSTQHWDSKTVVIALRGNLNDFIQNGVLKVLQTGVEEYGVTPLQNAQKIVDLFKVLLSPMIPSKKNGLLAEKSEGIIEATSALPKNVVLNKLLSAYAEGAYAINPLFFMALVPFFKSKKVQFALMILAVISLNVGLWYKASRFGECAKFAQAIRDLGLMCCPRREEDPRVEIVEEDELEANQGPRPGAKKKKE